MSEFKVITLDSFKIAINKIKEVLFRHKSRIDVLENKVAFLESKIDFLDENPWKMPFD